MIAALMLAQRVVSSVRSCEKSLAVGVGSNGENPVTEVRGADGTSGDTIPDRIEAERGQVPDHLSPDGSVMERENRRHVLDKDVSGSKLANGGPHVSPQNGFGVAEPLPLPRGGRALAREATGDQIDSSPPSVKGSDVVMDSGFGEPLGEDAPAPLVSLAQPSVLEPGEVEPEVEEADP